MRVASADVIRRAHEAPIREIQTPETERIDPEKTDESGHLRAFRRDARGAHRGPRHGQQPRSREARSREARRREARPGGHERVLGRGEHDQSLIGNRHSDACQRKRFHSSIFFIVVSVGGCMHPCSTSSVIAARFSPTRRARLPRGVVLEHAIALAAQRHRENGLTHTASSTRRRDARSRRARARRRHVGPAARAGERASS